MRELSFDELRSVVAIASGSVDRAKCDRIAAVLFAAGVRYRGVYKDFPIATKDSVNDTEHENSAREKNLFAVKTFLEG